MKIYKHLCHDFRNWDVKYYKGLFFLLILNKICKNRFVEIFFVKWGEIVRVEDNTKSEVVFHPPVIFFF